MYRAAWSLLAAVVFCARLCNSERCSFPASAGILLKSCPHPQPKHTQERYNCTLNNLRPNEVIFWLLPGKKKSSPKWYLTTKRICPGSGTLDSQCLFLSGGDWTNISQHILLSGSALSWKSPRRSSQWNHDILLKRTENVWKREVWECQNSFPGLYSRMKHVKAPLSSCCGHLTQSSHSCNSLLSLELL